MKFRTKNQTQRGIKGTLRITTERHFKMLRVTNLEQWSRSSRKDFCKKIILTEFQCEHTWRSGGELIRTKRKLWLQFKYSQ